MTNETDKSASGSWVKRNQSAAYMEEMSIENLAKEALAQTIREGGAFARENPDQFKQ